MYTWKVNYSFVKRAHEWESKTLYNYWIQRQQEIFSIGGKCYSFMKMYLKTNVHRKSYSPVPLRNAIKFWRGGALGAGIIEWGIGEIDVLDQTHPYWNILNYGVNFVPYANKKGVKGMFFPTGAPAAGATGNEPFIKGNQYFMKPKKAIRVVPYIDETDAYLMKLLRDFGKTIPGTGFKPFHDAGSANTDKAV